jgi:hypothetical protein
VRQPAKEPIELRTPTLVTRSALVGLASLGVAGAIAMSPTAALAADTASSGPGANKVIGYTGDLQPNGYYCGPAATRIAVSAYGHTPSFDDLAKDLGTTQSGTNSIHDVTRVLNFNVGGGYRSVEIPEQGANPEQTERLRTDVVTAINNGNPIVANIAGTTSDTIGELHSYPGGHYVTITGYTEDGRLISVADPADRLGSNEYQVPVDRMADWIATRGYATTS